MTTQIVKDQVDRRVNYLPHFSNTISQNTRRKIIEAFVERKNRATTTVASAAAVILALQMLTEIDKLIMVGLIAAATVFCWQKYHALCRCPNCEMSLLSGNKKWRRRASGFTSKSCPRCEIKLTKEVGGEKLTDAQSQKMEMQKIKKMF